MIAQNLMSSLVTGSQVTPSSPGSGVGWPSLTKFVHMVVMARDILASSSPSSWLVHW